ncbi:MULTISPECIES: cardiolipin synthase [unclassified Polaromonas]|uniref:cardiolipin synthase n=1 Tax=unclassified Polaromonas TaxID=2638319 RepID=UPI000F09659E|nr:MULTISPECIES: cardiolipin synthase [unclassified Polaromonas]AYQ29653.1 cardiolipin synthase [Polaromonas sp. SP1]QGJ19233.1 cardiolipin synthase [Polaromonas sp. Pch-P]
MTLPELSSEWKTGLSLAWSLYIAVLSVWIVMQKRAPVSTMSWILSLALLPFAGFVIYYFLGPQRLKKQRLKRLRSRAGERAGDDLALLREAAQSAPESLRQMAALGTAACGLPVSSATSVQLLSGGAQAFDSIFEAVRNARDHIHLEYYIFEPDKIGTALRDLLVQKAGEGVTVRLLVDALGSQRLGSKFLAPLEAAGAEVAFFHDTRIGRRLRPVTNYRTHRKIVVCDGAIGFTGGVNITDEEDMRTQKDAYHDVHLRIEGSAVRWLQTTFLEDWAYTTGDHPSDKNRALPHLLPQLLPGAGAGDIPVQIVTSGPDTTLEPIHRMHVAAINASTERAWLTTPYFVPGEPALMALTSAALRGVDVRLLVPRRSDSLIVSAAARSYYDELIAAGVKVWEYKARMLHSKTLVVDDNCAMAGTANFDNRSFRLNFEVMAVVYGPALAGPLAAQFETDLRSAAAVRAHRPQRFLMRLADSTARLFSPLL